MTIQKMNAWFHFFALHDTLTTAAPTSQIREAFND